MQQGSGKAAGAHEQPRRKAARWTQTMKRAFLDHLAATCDVNAAAAAIEVDAESVHGLRRSDAAFAAGWGEALAAGYEMLETRLIGHALAGGAGMVGAAGRAEPIDAELALRLLSEHRGPAAGASGRARRGGATARPASREQTDAAILRKLAQIERARGRA